MMCKEYVTRNYQARMRFLDNGKEKLELLGAYLGEIRNSDYAALVKSEQNKAEYSRKQRREYGRNNFLTTRIMDTIISSNNEQLEFAKRTSEANIQAWLKDIDRYEKQLKNTNIRGKKREYLNIQVEKTRSKISRSENRSPSCCFGGKKLQRDITLHPDDQDKRTTWVNKRMFLSFDGANHRSLGNDHVKLMPCEDKFLVVLALPKELSSNLGFTPMSTEMREKYGVKNNNHHVIGIIELKYGKDNVKYCLNTNTCLSYQFVWSHKKQCWNIHITTRINKYHIEQKNKRYAAQIIPGRVCGLDQNSGFITATIIDQHGNPLTQKTFTHSSSKEMSKLVFEIITWCQKNYCGVISIEKLTHLHQRARKSWGDAKAKNRVVNKIPYGEFTTRLAQSCEMRSIQLVKVFAGGTSSMTTQWKEDYFGQTIHEKASYLVARRGLGLSLKRRNRHHNSVCDEGVIPVPFEGSCDNTVRVASIHDSTCLSMCSGAST